MMTSAIGTFGGVGVATTVAITIYKLSVSLSKDASSAAKRDITLFLSTVSVPSDSSLIIRHIHSMFAILFTPRHLSVGCFVRSMFVTVSYFLIVILLFLSRYYPNIFDLILPADAATTSTLLTIHVRPFLPR
jgi:hypothetical protein